MTDYTAPAVHACPLCGSPVQRVTGKAGRPRDYCGDACRETSKLLGRLVAHLGKLRDRGLTGAASKTIRANVWSDLNVALNHRNKRAAAVPSASDVAQTAAV